MWWIKGSATLSILAEAIMQERWNVGMGCHIMGNKCNHSLWSIGVRGLHGLTKVFNYTWMNQAITHKSISFIHCTSDVSVTQLRRLNKEKGLQMCGWQRAHRSYLGVELWELLFIQVSLSVDTSFIAELKEKNNEHKTKEIYINSL